MLKKIKNPLLYRNLNNRIESSQIEKKATADKPRIHGGGTWCPETIHPKTICPETMCPKTICPGDNVPRRLSALETTCPGDNMPQETTCPRDNLPRRLNSPRQCSPETSCPGENPPRFQNTLSVLDYVRLG